MLQHLKSRYLDTNLHKVWLDVDVATFPLWNLTGQMVGYQMYRPNASKEKNNHPKEGRYFTYSKGKAVSVWGLESWNLSDTLFVTEGVFDAARLTYMGFSAVSVLSNNVAPTTKQWLWTVRQSRKVVCVCDNDAAGQKLKDLGTVSHTVEDFKDLGEASEEYVTNLLNEYK